MHSVVSMNEEQDDLVTVHQIDCRSAQEVLKESLKVSQAAQVIVLHSWNMVESIEKLPLLGRDLPF